jgi:hypothetical protein
MHNFIFALLIVSVRKLFSVIREILYCLYLVFEFIGTSLIHAVKKYFQDKNKDGVLL